MFSKRYQGELAFLRAAGKAYAEANPSTAGLLAERGTDNLKRANFYYPTTLCAGGALDDR